MILDTMTRNSVPLTQEDALVFALTALVIWLPVIVLKLRAMSCHQNELASRLNELYPDPLLNPETRAQVLLEDPELAQRTQNILNEYGEKMNKNIEEIIELMPNVDDKYENLIEALNKIMNDTPNLVEIAVPNNMLQNILSVVHDTSYIHRIFNIFSEDRNFITRNLLNYSDIQIWTPHFGEYIANFQALLPFIRGEDILNIITIMSSFPL